MKILATRLLFFCALTPVVFNAHGQEFAGSQSFQEKLVQAIEVASQGQLEILGIKETPLGNIYEVELNTGELLYSDESGDYLFAGDMYQTTGAGLMNLSSGTRQIRTLERVAKIPEEEMIIYSPEVEVQATITVFTDVDCTYCRALHRDMEDLLARGIQIRYLAYPRGGEAAGSYDKMISVWCSDDRHKSLTQAKNGQNLPERECDTPIMTHYDLGNAIGISGTPALIFPDGRVIPGYMEVERLVAMLNIE
ncbi:MAG: DsbC family protein [Gammaproteobacteria bacterium]|nr:DsbC family protein [Gammaproteobacteria bacterium]MDD9896338.1 DsbC family protein [Gammaproteobacteria bacterium]MDD9960021.1 DsbC family protein [Gammaproteobacteria bacterium]